MINTPPIHLALGTDENYVDFALITLTSIAAFHSEAPIHLHLMHENLSEQTIARFGKLGNTCGFQVFPLKMPREMFQAFPSLPDGRISPLVYRLALPVLLPDVEKIVYSDSDIIFLDDIAKLASIDLHGHALGAAPDRAGQRVPRGPEHDLPDEAVYFNDGLMVLDLNVMRKANSFARCQQLAKKHGKIGMIDQTLLNMLFWNNYERLPQRWNLINSIYRNLPLPGTYTIEETREAIQNPGAVHFTGHHKPWLFWKTTHHPYADRFWHFALEAPISTWTKIKIWLKAHSPYSCLKPPKKDVPWGSTDLKCQWPEVHEIKC